MANKPLTEEQLKDIRHSLKNHLSVIIAFSQLLQRPIPGQTEEQRRELIEKIENRAKKMVEEVDLSLTVESSME